MQAKKSILGPEHSTERSPNRRWQVKENIETDHPLSRISDISDVCTAHKKPEWT